MTEKKLQIGLMIDNYNQPAWVCNLIAAITKSNFSEIILLIKTDALKAEEKATAKNFLYRKFLKSDKNKYSLNPDALTEKDIRALIQTSDIVLNTRIHNGRVQSTKEAVSTIGTYPIDILLSLSTQNPLRDVLPSLPYDVWEYHFGDYNSDVTGPPGLMEFLTNKEATGVSIKAWGKNLGDDQLLSESFSSTDKFGLRRNRNNYLWKASLMMLRLLKSRYLKESSVFYTDAKKSYPTPLRSSQVFKEPSNWQMLSGLLSNYFTRFRNKIDRALHFEQYILLFNLNKSHDINGSFSDYKRITPPKDRFWADPFIYQKEHTFYIFLEELIYKNGLGTIGVLQIDENGNFGKPETVLEKDYHLSYPFLIEANGTLYMIPETKNNNTIQLYKCVDFPLKWEFVELIMDDVAAVDTTVYFHNDKYWMFTNMKEHQGISAYDELFLFYSDNLVGGNWTPHPQNPIVSDVRNARPAGAIYAENDKLYRPAQNCGKRYGYGMKIVEITCLTEEKYEEKIVRSIYPDWAKDLRTTHTINHNENLTIIDALIARRK